MTRAVPHLVNREEQEIMSRKVQTVLVGRPSCCSSSVFTHLEMSKKGCRENVVVHSLTLFLC